MQDQLDIIELVLGASIPVQVVMFILMMASFISWVMIFDRIRVLKRTEKATKKFEQQFWDGGDLAKLYRGLDQKELEKGGLSKIFHAGFREYLRSRDGGINDPMEVAEGAQRAMRASLSREVDQMETNLSFLATVGSISPYIGLFGTVWGIMISFHALGALKQATLQQVAPGISEALIATAMGLFAAIPAVIAYNKFSSQVIRLESRFEDFIKEFLNIIQRQVTLANKKNNVSNP